MLNPKPTVSVIIAVDRYQSSADCELQANSPIKRIKHLNHTINSVLRQTYHNFEVLVYGDSTLAAQADFELIRDFRLRYIFSNNSGIFSAFNQGIAEAQGKYITFLKINDFWHLSKLQKQVDCLDKEPEVGLVYSWIVPVDAQGHCQGRMIKSAAEECSRTDILQRNRIHYQSVMLRRDCFKKVGLFDLSLRRVQDWDLWIRLSCHYQFMAIAQPLVFCLQLPRNNQSWLVMETNLQQTIEKAYDRVNSVSKVLKNRSYAYASLHLAREVLQNQKPDPLIAGNYRRQALEHYPQIGFSLFFLRISLAISLLYCLKGESLSSATALDAVHSEFCSCCLQTVEDSKICFIAVDAGGRN